MTTKKRQNPQRFAPVEGEVYENAGGGSYYCKRGGSWDSALMVNTVSGWTFTACGIVRYEDGTIEWDYSTGGHFEKLPEQEPAEIYHRQRSLVNAMLCCMI